ncbi:hypothetical protein RDWZM_000249, partial [Blomia tropicalis]
MAIGRFAHSRTLFTLMSVINGNGRLEMNEMSNLFPFLTAAVVGLHSTTTTRRQEKNFDLNTQTFDESL